MLLGCLSPRSGWRGAVAKSSEPSLDTVEQRVSYGIALNLGANLARQGLAVDLPAFLAGLQDGLAGKPARLPESELRAAFEVAQEKTKQAGAGRAAQQAGATNAFLDANKARPGVVVTPSGLHYEVLRAGKGAKPTRDQTVEVHYHGTLPDGTVFDSSVERGETISFPVTGVIPGWIEALQLMQVGAKWRLVIPSDLAYGPEGSGPIPPGATLVFEVELIAIE
ncbi:MAG: FKBP-type peptidyl-prolyl cis-trans isomerase FklB [Verrucomicrobia bacterium]|jgi:FKBP-type peptidyl-prolyl cis-trans isomerase FklB|nr:MAG: FKBP-type peptidyl-prolyl cis-trans isomerase FklB [Verrucomicrobiota bacterium]